MTAGPAAHVAGPDPVVADEGRVGPWHRTWSKPLWAHALALLVVLLLVSWWVGTDVSFSIDEPAAIAQGQRLADGQGWQVANPLPTIDPSGEWFYVVRSDTGPGGVVLYGKHPLYPLLLSVADRVAGQAAMVGLSLLGAVATAVIGALIARRLDPRLDRLALWSLGIGSPLLFDGQLVIAHTLGAAAAGGAALLVLQLLDRWRWQAVLGAAGLVAVTSLLRTEGLVFAAVLAGAALVVAIARRSWRWVVTGAALGVGAAGAALFDRIALGRMVGTISSVYAVGLDSQSFLQGRLPAFVTMLVSPGDSWVPLTRWGLLTAMVGAAALGLLLRFRPDLRLATALAAVVLVGGAVLPLLGEWSGIIPSLLAACPVLIVGLLCLGRDALAPPTARLLAGVSLAYALLVALSQYNQAGGIEWGARYMALILPLLVPLVLWSLALVVRRVGDEVARLPLVGCVVATVVLSVLSVGVVHDFHDGTRRFTEHLRAATAQVAGPDLGGADRRPIVVTDWYVVGRITAGTGPSVRGLTVVTDPRADLPVVAQRLDEAGVDEFVYVAAGPEDAGLLGDRYRVTPADPDGDERIFIARRRT